VTADLQLAIEPMVGIGTLKFSMVANKVSRILGPPDQISTNHLRQMVEFRSFRIVAFSNDTRHAHCHIGLGRQMTNVTLGDCKLFIEEPIVVLRHLMSPDSASMLYLGFVIFLKLGIILTSFHDDDKSQSAVALFERGQWDSRLCQMQPFRLG
jgi:hypothetical protein